MSFMIAFTALVGVLGVLNLFLTTGVIRRLRERSAPPQSLRPEPPKVMIPNGTEVGSFTASTVDEEQVSPAIFADGVTLVGVFAQGCESCDERLPDFLSTATTFPGGRERVFALLIGAGEDVVEKRAALSRVGRVVLEEKPGGPVAKAFGVKGYPAFAMVDSLGRVRSSGVHVEHATSVTVGA
ncbi:Thiol-disulfide isomerase or thioredoxin [Lentzea xinjiangensis]|uniref:Thiol-disulfide isomerase or thioredoxin n=1 Tax=Lentzea xinjiangensis TaxID=402600 RepID=A0A1H9D8Y2_9PSEU|nr:TlpA family protein disulfide reductase [Lentzea xinjiangensis]SEQ09945.1 Thiol-disulfide isomerase or thioredoxin [Lentzea xinjiangensis]